METVDPGCDGCKGRWPMTGCRAPATAAASLAALVSAPALVPPAGDGPAPRAALFRGMVLLDRSGWDDNRLAGRTDMPEAGYGRRAALPVAVATATAIAIAIAIAAAAAVAMASLR